MEEKKERKATDNVEKEQRTDKVVLKERGLVL